MKYSGFLYLEIKYSTINHISFESMITLFGLSHSLKSIYFEAKTFLQPAIFPWNWLYWTSWLNNCFSTQTFRTLLYLFCFFEDFERKQKFRLSPKRKRTIHILLNIVDIFWVHMFVLINPFGLLCRFYDIRRGLVNKPSIITCFRSTFCPICGNHQECVYCKRHVTFSCTLLLWKNEHLYWCIV